MSKENLTTEELVGLWEDQRDIKNLMGIYVNYIILNEDAKVVKDLWADRDDICLGFNDGWYIGREAVSSYYEAVKERNQLVASLLKERLDDKLEGKNEEELFGIGTFRVLPVSCPVIEVAGDGKTAKGLFYCMGAHAEVEEIGPNSKWSWGYYAVDFLRDGDEDGNNWKIWHMTYTNDVDSRCGESWGMELSYRPELPEFKALGEYKMPEYTKRECLRELWNLSRPLSGAPRLPEAYETFSETFSYGA